MQRTMHRLVMLTHAASVAAFAAVWFLPASPLYGQAVIRARDVASADWTTPAAPLAPAWSSATSASPAFGSPSWNQQPNAWRLGVAIENRETGVLLTDVERGMPADGAGLQRGDLIVGVGGYQVGYVDGALYDLGDELRKRTDPQGHVTFLVFDAHNRQLRSMPVTLVQSGSTSVRGQVVCRERISISSQATLTVRMRDVTFPSWQNVSVGQQVIPNPPHPPIPFSIDFDPSTVYPDHRYAVDAWLVDGGQVVLQTSSPVSVTPLSNAGQVQVSLVRPTASAPPTNVYASAQLEQINQWYRQYLLRDATTQELAVWQAHLQAGRPVQDVQAFILSGSEYYDRMGNQAGRYLAELYRNLYGRQPTQAELAQFQSQYQQYGGARSLFVQEAMQRTPGF